MEESPDAFALDEHESRILKKIANLKKMAALPSSMKRRIQALRKLQLETIDIEAQFHAKVFELEMKFGKLHSAVNKKRNKIIAGDYEPTDQECDFPDIDLSEDLEQVINELEDNEPLPEDLSNAKGIPKFWITVLKSIPMFETFIKSHDEPALEFLTDIRTSYSGGDKSSFIIEFEFLPNPYFSNAVLTKEYFMKHNPDPDDQLAFDGPEIVKCKGCPINWKEGMDLTVRTVKRKGNLNPEYMHRTIKIGSFFNFFEPPEFSEDMEQSLLEDINAILETDFEIGHYLKERIIPRAVLFYTGEVDDCLSQEEEEEEDEEEDEIPLTEEETEVEEAEPAPERSCSSTADEALEKTEKGHPKE